MGRTKQFTREDVTEKALQLFWRKGYLDTSLQDLEEATGVFRPALYSEFGSKEGLFFECFRHYLDNHSGSLRLRPEPLGWKNIEAFLLSLLPRKGEKGCLAVTVLSRDIPALDETLKKMSTEHIKVVTRLLEDNLLAAGVAPGRAPEMAAVIHTFYCGISALVNMEPRNRLESHALGFLEQLRAQTA